MSRDLVYVQNTTKYNPLTLNDYAPVAATFDGSNANVTKFGTRLQCVPETGHVLMLYRRYDNGDDPGDQVRASVGITQYNRSLGAFETVYEAAIVTENGTQGSGNIVDFVDLSSVHAHDDNDTGIYFAVSYADSTSNFGVVSVYSVDATDVTSVTTHHTTGTNALTYTGGVEADQYGSSVLITKKFLFVGASGLNSGAGGVYVYPRVFSDGGSPRKIVENDIAPVYVLYDSSVMLATNAFGGGCGTLKFDEQASFLYVSAPDADKCAVFEVTNTGTGRQISESTSSASIDFTSNVFVSGDEVRVLTCDSYGTDPVVYAGSSTYDNGAQSERGEVSVYKYSSSTWSYVESLGSVASTASVTSISGEIDVSSMHFGASACTWQTYAGDVFSVVGAPYTTGPRVFVFSRNASTAAHTLVKVVYHDTTNNASLLGSYVTVFGNANNRESHRILAAAPDDNNSSPASSTGSVFATNYHKLYDTEYARHTYLPHTLTGLSATAQEYVDDRALDPVTQVVTEMGLRVMAITSHHAFFGCPINTTSDRTNVYYMTWDETLGRYNGMTFLVKADPAVLAPFRVTCHACTETIYVDDFVTLAVVAHWYTDVVYVYSIDASNAKSAMQTIDNAALADTITGTKYGRSLFITSKYLFIAASDYATYGAVFIYTRASGGATYDVSSRVLINPTAYGTGFGSSICFNDDYLYICSDDDETNTSPGKTIVYTFDGSTATFVAEVDLTLADSNPSDKLGATYQSQVVGDFLYLSAQYNDDLGTNAGDVYVYKHVYNSPGTPYWEFIERLSEVTYQNYANLYETSTNDLSNLVFGRFVSAHDRYVAVGAYNLNQTDGSLQNTGGVFIFRRDANGFHELIKLVVPYACVGNDSSNPGVNENDFNFGNYGVIYGSSLITCASNASVASYLMPTGCTSTGVVYTHQMSLLYEDNSLVTVSTYNATDHAVSSVDPADTFGGVGFTNDVNDFGIRILHADSTFAFVVGSDSINTTHTYVCALKWNGSSSQYEAFQVVVNITDSITGWDKINAHGYLRGNGDYLLAIVWYDGSQEELQTYVWTSGTETFTLEDSAGGAAHNGHTVRWVDSGLYMASLPTGSYKNQISFVDFINVSTSYALDLSVGTYSGFSSAVDYGVQLLHVSGDTTGYAIVGFMGKANTAQAGFGLYTLGSAGSDGETYEYIRPGKIDDDETLAGYVETTAVSGDETVVYMGSPSSTGDLLGGNSSTNRGSCVVTLRTSWTGSAGSSSDPEKWNWEFVEDLAEVAIAQSTSIDLSGSKFGTSVATWENWVAIGAPYFDWGLAGNETSGTDSGAAFLFQRNTQSNKHDLKYVLRMKNGVGATGDMFGSSISVNDTGILVSAPGESVGGTHTGVVYNFSVSTCVAYDTLVRVYGTQTGKGKEYKPICELKRGDLVWTKDSGYVRLARSVTFPGVSANLCEIRPPASSEDLLQPFEPLTISYGHPVFCHGHFVDPQDLVDHPAFPNVTPIPRCYAGDDERKTGGLFTLQFETHEVIDCNGVLITSLPPYTQCNGLELPRDLYFNPELYSLENRGKHYMPFMLHDDPLPRGIAPAQLRAMQTASNKTS